ncbi:MAG: TrkA family potassium uptake protein [Candidatus Tectomicrobia bacterium]|uniref:TrkA family potassium uptake protein n=1 Tax=Tectimicrobiota bacterium TaxID=2528274 RepID=A0A932CPC2_UNCTE|nr:TrkA family potassium uptake protein [Candidatus Tectomicrobia bacterium]
MKVIIFGCGRLGASLAQALSEAGEEVAVIDRDPRAFRLLGNDFQGRTIVGTGGDEEILKEVGIEEADAFAAVTNGDKINIMCSLIAQQIYQVPTVIARIADPKMEEIYRELGLKTLCPTRQSTEVILHLLKDSR